ncbi:MAG: DUF1302 domain-containing protein [Verrucomicrobia bacterium]|nr:DUF1302 domain-containing protein [Verrucomicrobiota bacterium]
MKDHATLSVARRRAHAALAASVGLALLATASHAIQFSNGGLTGSFDSTISFGALYRLKDPTNANYGTTNSFNGVPGLLNSVNTDDGNLNYGKGWVSELFKGSHDLELKYGNFGALVRGYWFTDLKTDDTKRTTLSDQAKDRVVRGAEFLDMYARAKFAVGSGLPVDVRFGRQVLSLGESTFIPNGNNVVNSVDLSKLRTPGAELKEALLPVNMLKASIGVAENVTIEPFWLLEFRRNELEPAGTYFSTNDFATRGGSQVLLGFGTLADTGTLGAIPRDKDREGSNFNQYGVATRVLAPGLNNTEFGAFYARYNSRSPLLSARAPTSPINTDLTGPLTVAFIRGGVPAAAAPAQAAAIFQLIVKSTLAPATLTPTEIATLQSAPIQAAISGARSIALLTAAATGRYFAEYPEGLNLYGLSFNTSIGKTGISWQGEVSLKKDVPLQIDDVELLFATLSALTNSTGSAFGSSNQIGNYLGQLGREIPGYRRHNVWTAQSTVTKVFGPTLGSQQFTLLGEAGGVWANLPGKDTLRYDGPGTFTSGSAAAMLATPFPTIPPTPTGAFADKFSWGYQVLGRLDYNSVFRNVNMQPSVAFTHDVSGNTPLPLGNYVKGRKSVNVAVEFVYRNAWSVELRYVNFFGAGRFNLLTDRDYFATTLKYSF